MDTIEDARNWGDPYIGLHMAAQAVQRFTEIAVDTPLFARQGMYSALGSPSIFDTIANAIGSVAHWIQPRHWAPWIWGLTVAPAIGWLREYVFNPLRSTIEYWLSSVRSAVSGIGWDLYGRFVGFIASGLGKIGDLVNWLRFEAVPAIADVGRYIAGIPESIYSWFAGSIEWIKDQLRQLGPWWREQALPWLQNIWSAIAGIGRNIYSWFAGAIEGFKAKIAEFPTWWRETAWPWIAGLPGRIWAGLQAWWATAWPKIVAWCVEATIDIAEFADRAIATVGPIVRRWMGAFNTIPSTFLNWVAGTAGTDLALRPSQALVTAGSLYGMSIAAGTTAHVLSTALNAIPATNWVGLSQLSAYIAQAAAFRPLTDATYGVLINDCLTQPMRYHWNQMLRPRIPSEGAIYAMGRKRGIDQVEFRQAMAYHGLPDLWIDREYANFWADPSPYWLLRMSEQATPKITDVGARRGWLDRWVDGWESDPWAWFKMKLKLAGYEDTDIGPFIEGFQRRRLASAVTQIKTSVRAMVRESYWGITEVKAALEPLGVREAEIDLLVKAEEIDYQNRFLDDEVRYLTESFRKGEISGQDLSLALSLFIVKPERVAQIVSRERVRALPKPKSVVPVKEDPRVKSLITQAVGSWTKGYRAWEVEEEELEIGLTIVLQDPDLARQMVTVERTRYRPEPPPPVPPVEDPLIRKSRTAAIASWVSQFREGVITADVMELGLANLIVDPDIVVLIRQIEELRAVPAPGIIPPWEEDPLIAAVRQQAVTGHIEMFRKRLIAIDELYAYLVADGLAEPLARAPALTPALKRIKTPPRASPYCAMVQIRELIDEAIEAYTRMLELGQISLEEYEVYLAGTGVDPAVITYLGDTQEVRQFILLEGMA